MLNWKNRAFISRVKVHSFLRLSQVCLISALHSKFRVSVLISAVLWTNWPVRVSSLGLLTGSNSNVTLKTTAAKMNMPVGLKEHKACCAALVCWWRCRVTWWFKLDSWAEMKWPTVEMHSLGHGVPDWLLTSKNLAVLSWGWWESKHLNGKRPCYVLNVKISSTYFFFWGLAHALATASLVTGWSHTECSLK